MTTFSSLPNEIRLQILQKCDRQSLKNLKELNKFHYNFIEHHRLLDREAFIELTKPQRNKICLYITFVDGYNPTVIKENFVVKVRSPDAVYKRLDKFLANIIVAKKLTLRNIDFNDALLDLFSRNRIKKIEEMHIDMNFSTKLSAPSMELFFHKFSCTMFKFQDRGDSIDYNLLPVFNNQVLSKMDACFLWMMVDFDKPFTLAVSDELLDMWMRRPDPPKQIDFFYHDTTFTVEKIHKFCQHLVKNTNNSFDLKLGRIYQEAKTNQNFERAVNQLSSFMATHNFAHKIIAAPHQKMHKFVRPRRSSDSSEDMISFVVPVEEDI